LFNKGRKDREIQDELESHIQMHMEDNLRSGMKPEEARRQAMIKLGGIESTKEAYREQRGLPLLESLLEDLRFGARMLQKNPGFTGVALLTLALGIGANTAIFSVINAVLVRPLPFRNPSRLVWAANTGGGGLSGATTQVANYADWRKLNHSFSDLCAYHAFFDYSSYTLTGQGEPERFYGVGVSQNFLDVLGLQPALGRGFSDEECEWNGPNAALLTDGFWRTRFGGDATIVGRSLSLNNQPYTIVGILPASFDFSSVFTPGSHVDFLLPFPICEETDRMGNSLSVIGRLKPGVSIENAQSEFDVMNKQLEKAHPERNTPSAKMTALQGQVSGGFRRSFAVLFGAVGSVLLIACANLSNLLLARAAARRKEIAVRMALGASRARLLRQMLTESLLLSCCGAAIGLPLAMWATRALASLRAFNVPLLQTATVDATALTFTLAVAVSTGVLIGIIPAFQITGQAFLGEMKEASRGTTAGSGRARIRDVLVVSEVALACMLLVGAGLFLHSFARLLEVDPGFQPARAVAWRIETARQFSNPVEENMFYEDLINRIQNLPGVESAGLTDTLPLGRNRSWIAGAKGESYPGGNFPVVFPRVVDEGYLRTMRIPLRAGRGFDARDNSQSEQNVVINENMAKSLWPVGKAVGQVVAVVNGKDYQYYRVIGVVGNVRHSALETEAGAEMYLLGSQIGWGSMDLVVRTRESVESLVPNVRATLKQVDPNLPSAQFQTLGQIVDQAVSPKRFITFLLAAFSFLALALASLGIYAVISYSIVERTREIGIRLALGASTRNLLILFVRQGMIPAAVGLGLGIVGALALTRVLASQLYEVEATDPLTFIIVTAALLFVALSACCLPARRVTSVDPMVVLRCD
jgi:predicted permease